MSSHPLPTQPAHFSGSYSPEDIEFLLTEHDIANTSVADKEALIQSGQKHYSELLTRESSPSAVYQALFDRLLPEYTDLLARHLIQLAAYLKQRYPAHITLVSLARAGTPYGILLKRVLQDSYNTSIKHCSVSIMRDHGLDLAALRHILKYHPDTSLAFIDGWTGKGVITQTLKTSINTFNQTYGTHILPELFVLNDPGYQADYAASYKDELVISCLLNATVSGLISRTVRPANASISTQLAQFDQCVYYKELLACDRSNLFIDAVWQAIEQGLITTPLAEIVPAEKPDQTTIANHHAHLHQWLCQTANEYQLPSLNLIKPGLGEATRALLRRQVAELLVHPDMLQHNAYQHLNMLAAQHNISIRIVNDCPYQAVAIIAPRESKPS